MKRPTSTSFALMTAPFTVAAVPPAVDVSVSVAPAARLFPFRSNVAPALTTRSPVTGIWTAFNQIPGRKEVVPLVEAAHDEGRQH